MAELTKKERISLDILKTLIPAHKDMPSETPKDLVRLSCEMAKLLITESEKELC